MTDTWLSMEVAAELAKAASPPLQLPPQGITFLAAIVEARSFRSLYGDRADNPRLWSGSLDEFPPEDQIGGTGPDGRQTHPFGAWQWEPGTARDIAVGIGTPSVTPENQIRGSWWLAQRDYRAHSGAELLPALIAAGRDIGALDAIGAALRSTWPGGARAGFAERYLAPLPSRPGQPIPLPQIILHYGETRPVALDGFDADGKPESLPTSGETITVDDETVCAAAMHPSGQWVLVTWRGPGSTVVHCALPGALRADLEVTVAALVKIAFNPDRQPDPQLSAAPSG